MCLHSCHPSYSAIYSTSSPTENRSQPFMAMPLQVPIGCTPLLTTLLDWAPIVGMFVVEMVRATFINQFFNIINIISCRVWSSRHPCLRVHDHVLSVGSLGSE